MLSTPLTFIELSIVFIPILAIALAKLLHSDSQKLKVYLSGQWFAFALSIFGFAFYLLTPNQSFSSVMPTPFEIRIDFLAVCLTVLVTFISSVVVAYSERYLLGTKTRTNFIQIVTLITPLASLLVMSNNLILCAICWHGISLVLWKLIGLRAEARGQARVVLFHHLLSDALMAIAVATLVYYCQTATITELYTRSSVLEKQVFLFGTPLAVPLSSIINLLLIISMSIKSALFPFHRWLLATLEAPTPLSGILHAGVVNVSAIMAARLFPILQESPSLLIAWGLFSAVSAVVGTLIMSTQSDVKRKLVYSTVGQMGFMCLQCASGSIPAAIFHLIAHGLFKCHLFLQSGSAVSEGRAKKQWGSHSDAGAMEYQNNARLIFSLLMATCVCTWLFLNDPNNSGTAISGVISMTAIGFTMNSTKRTDLILFVSSGLALYFTVILSGTVAHKLEASLAASPTNSGLLIGSIFAFAIISLVLHLLKKTGIGRAIYVLVLNGFYTDEIATAFKNQIDLKSRMRSRKILKADT